MSYAQTLKRAKQILNRNFETNRDDRWDKANYKSYKSTYTVPQKYATYEDFVGPKQRMYSYTNNFVGPNRPMYSNTDKFVGPNRPMYSNTNDFVGPKRPMYSHTDNFIGPNRPMYSHTNDFVGPIKYGMGQQPYEHIPTRSYVKPVITTKDIRSIPTGQLKMIKPINKKRKISYSSTFIGPIQPKVRRTKRKMKVQLTPYYSKYAKLPIV